jgi:hypothetical protein
MDMTFDEWLAAVDKILTDKLGLGLESMRDRNTRDAFDDEVSPEDWVEEEFGTDPEEMMRNELFG